MISDDRDSSCVLRSKVLTGSIPGDDKQDSKVSNEEDDLDFCEVKFLVC